MLDVIKKLMEAAEELGTVTKFSACDWVNPGDYRVTIEGSSAEGMAFEIVATLTPPQKDKAEK